MPASAQMLVVRVSGGFGTGYTLSHNTLFGGF